MFLSLQETYFCAYDTRNPFVSDNLTRQLFYVWADEMNLSFYSQNAIKAVK